MTAPALREPVATPIPRRLDRSIAVAAALAAGAGLAAIVAGTAPHRAAIRRGPPPVPPEGDPAVTVEREAAALLPVLRGFRSEDPVVRRQTAGVVERLVAESDPRHRLALAAALRALGGREAVLPLCLLVGDEDPDVRIVARRALAAEADRAGRKGGGSNSR